MLYLIGLGLKAKDLTLEALELLNRIDLIFYESYTSIVDWISEVEALAGKKFKKLERKDLEEESKKLIDLAYYKDIIVLVSGDPLAATTHQALVDEARKAGVKVKVIHAPSVLTTVGETGLWLYKFGRVVTIPEKGAIGSVKEYVENNRKIGLHTLVLLDVGMNANSGLSRMLKEKIIKLDEKVIICAHLGEESQIMVGEVEKLMKQEFERLPHCIILLGKLNHFEEDNI